MYKYSTLLFDLDGTITDSAPGIINCFKYALSCFGIEETDDDKLKVVMGPPLKESFMSLYNLSEGDALKAISKYRERYEESGIYENELYDGIENVIKKLSGEGFKLALATCKPEVYSKRIIEYFGLTKYFDFVTGASLDESRATKEAVIEHIFKEIKITDKSKVVMIGDRMHDLVGAQLHGIDAIGVLYGYGTFKELNSHKSVYLAKDTMDLYNYLTLNP